MVADDSFFIFTRNNTMKNNSKITLALTAVATAALVIYLTRCVNAKRMLVKVADEGYETAHDILYPGKDNGGKELRYGPTLPR